MTCLALVHLGLARGLGFACAILFHFGNTPVRAGMMNGNHGGQHQPAKDILPGHGNTDGPA